MDPIYEYVKGDGWVLQTCESVVITNHVGQRVRLELRKPQNGELYFTCTNAWDINRWIDWAKESSNIFKGNETRVFPRNQRINTTHKSICVLTWLDD